MKIDISSIFSQSVVIEQLTTDFWNWIYSISVWIEVRIYKMLTVMKSIRTFTITSGLEREWDYLLRIITSIWFFWLRTSYWSRRLNQNSCTRFWQPKRLFLTNPLCTTRGYSISVIICCNGCGKEEQVILCEYVMPILYAKNFYWTSLTQDFMSVKSTAVLGRYCESYKV